MSFLSSIGDAFKSVYDNVLKPGFNAIAPVAAPLVGGFFGGPGGAAIGHGITGMLSNLMNGTAQSGQNTANQYMSPQMQQQPMGNVLRQGGQNFGGQLQSAINSRVPNGYQSTDFGSIGQQAGGDIGGWAGNKIASMLPRGFSHYGQNIQDYARQAGQNFGEQAQNYANQFMPRNFQDMNFGNVGQNFGNFAGNQAQGFANRYMNRDMRKMPAGNFGPSMINYGAGRAGNEVTNRMAGIGGGPEQIGLASMGYADGGPVEYNQQRFMPAVIPNFYS